MKGELPVPKTEDLLRESLGRKIDEVGLPGVEPIELRLELLPQQPVGEFEGPFKL